MALIGVLCGRDGTYQSFDTCIHRHECGDGGCDALVQILKLMRDNHIDRKDAGWSASTLTSCARAVALREKYDYYEDVKSGYNKGRGTWVHAMMESDLTPREGVIKERRIERFITINGKKIRLTGKPDEIDTKRRLLIDFKSKDRVPKKLDPHHEAQFNVYIWLIRNGVMLPTEEHPKKEKIQIEIVGGGMHYLTWNPKEPWKKMPYPVWTNDEVEAFIVDRLTPLVRWNDTHVLPSCNAYVRYPGRYWRCDCEKLSSQLEELGALA